MATHSSVLAWRILGTGEPGGVAQSRTRLKRLSSSSRVQQLAYKGWYQGQEELLWRREAGRGMVEMKDRQQQEMGGKL